MYLYGASGHAKVIIDILKANKVDIEGLIDDNPAVNELLGYPVFHGREDLSPLIISIGDNKIRRMIAEKLKVEFGTAIHPSSLTTFDFMWKCFDRGRNLDWSRNNNHPKCKDR